MAAAPGQHGPIAGPAPMRPSVGTTASTGKTTPVRRPAPKRRGRAIAASLLVLLLSAGGLAYVKSDAIAELLAGVSLPISALTSVADSGFREAPFATSGTDAESIDRTFQRAQMWRHIKQEYPEWYGERVQETAKFAAEKRGEAQIAKHLAEAVVSLRRKHATQALTASPDRLKFVASAFLDNLQALSKRNVEVCYGFISQGETYPAILDMLQEKNVSEPLQRQVIAVFEAIADGRKDPQTHLPPRKSDYDLLAAELTSRGWSQTDLQTFSDPRALGRAAPSQVCKMVQDWFAAQIAIKDPASQLRLLVESLRPVVAG